MYFVDQIIINRMVIFRTVISKTFAMQEAGAAHQFMEDNANIGKIMLKIE
jgi:hypothetical protein